MSRRSRYRQLACAALWAACVQLWSACSEEPTKLTQIVVVIDSDLPVPAELNGLHIEVSGTKPTRVIDTSLDADHPLPRTLGIVHSGGRLGPVRVLARGTFAGETIVERVADVQFKQDRTLKLLLPLMRACLKKEPGCESDQTCDLGACVPAAVSSLPVFDGKDGPFVGDASVRGDGGLDAAAAIGDGGDTYDGDAQPSAAPGGEAGAGDGITCTINEPGDGDSFYEGDALSFEAGCLGADGEPVSFAWISSLDGTFDSNKITKKGGLKLGTHELRVCADGTSVCSTPLQITIQALPELSASISSLAQVGASDNVYSASAELVVNGEGTGVLPLTLSWVDSLAGPVASGKTFRFTPPMLAGRHMLRLMVTDARGRKASAERGFVVYSAGRSALFETFDVANAVLDAYGTVTALTSDGDFHYVGTKNGYVLQVSADVAAMTNPVPTPTALMPPRPAVHDLSVHRSSNTLYVATSSDVQACSIANATLSTCTKLPLGGFAAAVPLSVRRVTSAGSDYLAVGTETGLWVGALTMLGQGSLRENSAAFNAMTESAGKLWIAGSTGLSGYTLGSGGGLSGSPERFDGSTGALTSIVASADTLYASLTSGFTRYDAGDDGWSTWTTSYTQALFGRLVNNDVRSIAITHPVIDDVAHDVIWVATASGLSRFDPALPSFTTYTKVDGLPDNSVLRVVGLSSNELLLATPVGLAIHRGQ